MAFPETAKLVFFSRKAHGGKKRKLIRAVMNPPSYPATRSRGPVVPPLVDETTHLCLERPGRLAPRWLEDFISGDLDDALPVVQDVGCANIDFRRDAAERLGHDDPDGAAPLVMRHQLLLKGHQSFQGDQSESSRRADNRACDEVYSCVCQNCRYHFTFYIDRKSSTSCGLNRGNNKDPFHHLVFVLNDSIAPTAINKKFYPYHGHSEYICSAKSCEFKLTVEISLPRLNERFLTFLTDNDRIRNRLKLAIEKEPDRFADVANVTPNALTYLRIYLRDIVEGKKDKNADGEEVDRKIDQRNKKFYVQFGDGPDAAELFTFLGFEEVIDGDNRSWKVPSPAITRPTRPGSQLAFYQDIKSEVETIIGKDSQNMKPNAAISFITNALDIGDYAISDKGTSDDYQAADYMSLGLLPRMHESYFFYAFGCQRQTYPEGKQDFFHSLQRLARGRNNEELEMRVQYFDSMNMDQPAKPRETDNEDDEIRRATELSLKEMQPPPAPLQLSSDDKVTAAYNYFGLPPDQRTDDEVLGKYESLSDSYPSQRSLYREKLLLIARHTDSRSLQERATEDMSVDESFNYLGVQAHTETEYIVNIAQYACNSGEKDYALVATALRNIGVARNNDQTLLQAATMTMIERGHTYPIGPYNRMDLDTAPVRNEPVNLNLPVGLENIRNTCYLNSILQYFFTVKPIREIVLDIDKYGLQDTEANLERRRIDPGSTHLEKGEAFAGQQFVLQLSLLFQDLLHSPEMALRPPQSLALAALKNPKQLETDGAKILAKDQDHPVAFDLGSRSGKESPAPPLPARHAPVPPVPPRTTNAIPHPESTPRVAVSQVSEVDNADSSSTRSSETLVNQADEGWQNVPKVSVTMEELPTVTHTEDAGDHDLPPPYDTGMADDSGDIKMSSDSAPAVGDSRAQETAPTGIQLVFDPPPVAEPTVEEKIACALNDSSVSGTDQQDVEEVMGNIISHLRAAVKPTGEDEETGVQKDPITDTFFWTSVTYNRSNGAEQYNRQVAPNRWVTAYPDERGEVISLLQALDNSFQREFITQGTTRYERFTSILDLPPILHVHIQRTTRNGGKNNTAIDIPVSLHLDRFMDSPVDSELFARRRRAWNLQERIRSLKGPNGEKAELDFPEDAIQKASRYTHAVVAEYLHENIKSAASKKGKEREDDAMESESGGQTVASNNVDGIDDDDDSDSISNEYFVIDDEIKALMDENGITIASTDALDMQLEADIDELVDRKAAASAVSKEFMDDVRRLTPQQIQDAWLTDAAAFGDGLVARQADETADLELELSGLFDDLRAPEHEYLLHAVVCHAGQTGKSGHYWVWVFDFERRLWRRYNDSTVTEEPDAEKVMRQLSTQGEPYYLAYVRASDVDSMVSIPTREVPTSPPAVVDEESFVADE